MTYFKSNNHYPLASQTNPPMNRKDHIGLLFYLEKNYHQTIELPETNSLNVDGFSVCVLGFNSGTKIALRIYSVLEN